jgi:hypothetical protein
MGNGRSSVCEACGLTFEASTPPQTDPDSVTGNGIAAERVAP